MREFPLPFGYELKGDDNDNPRQSTLTLARDGQPLGPPHSVHETIANKGAGAYSHWQTGIYFSTPGNSDPRSDGHTYTVRATGQLRQNVRTLLTVAAIVLALPLAYASGRLLRQRSRMLVSPLKLVALAIMLILAPWFWLLPISRETQRLALAGNWLLLVVYVAGVVAAIASLLIAPFIRNWRIRVPLVLLLLAAFAIDQMMLSVSRQPMSFELMQTFLRERAMAATVLPAYGAAIFNNLGLIAVLAIPLLLAPSSRFALPARYSIGVRRGVCRCNGSGLCNERPHRGVPESGWRPGATGCGTNSDQLQRGRGALPRRLCASALISLQENRDGGR